MISLYRPGTGFLHRLSATSKLIGLMVISLVVAIMPHTVWSISAVGIAVIVIYFTSGVGLGLLFRQVWQLKWLIAMLAAFLWIFSSAEAAWINTVRVIAILTLAGVVTATTRMEDLLDVLRRALTPFARWGVNPDAVALTISLTLTMVPVVAGFLDVLREAQRARGVRLGPRVVVPLLVMAMRHADDVGDALVARGVVT